MSVRPDAAEWEDRVLDPQNVLSSGGYNRLVAILVSGMFRTPPTVSLGCPVRTDMAGSHPLLACPHDALLG